ncbi:MAG TPA: nuclease [Lachnospiraceae bacterium]|nr:nuclease [Lachnospiraceae bacterium]
MLEKEVEEKLVRMARMKGGHAWKFVSPGMSGVPDRIVLMPGGRMAFVEVKRPGEKMRPLQLRRKRQIEALGFRVYCLDDPEKVGGVIDAIENRV